MKSKIIQRRATVFVDQAFEIDEFFIDACTQRLADLGFIPTSFKKFGMKIEKGIAQTFVKNGLEMRHKVMPLIITFDVKRFDFISQKDFDTEATDDFVKLVKDSSVVLLDILNQKPARLAMGSISVLHAERDGIADIYKHIVSSSEDERPVEWAFRKVLRTEETFGEIKIMMNRVFTLSALDVANKKPEMGIINLEQDLNTVLDESSDIISDIQNAFWSQIDMCLSHNIEKYGKLIEK